MLCSCVFMCSLYPKGIDVDNQKQREEHVLLNDAIKAKNNPNYKPIISPGGECREHTALYMTQSCTHAYTHTRYCAYSSRLLQIWCVYVIYGKYNLL